MKKVFIWGCGKYGQYLYNALTKYYNKRFKVLGFIDSRHVELSRRLANGENVFNYIEKEGTGLTIYDINSVKQLIDDGYGDGIFIGILDKGEYKKIEDIVSVMGIEIYTLHCNDRVFAFEVAETVSNEEYGLKLYTIQNVTIFANPNCNNNYRFSYIFTQEGMVLQETDRYLELTASTYEEIFLPYDVKDSPDVSVSKAFSVLQLGTDFNYGHFLFSCISKIFYMAKKGYDGCFILYESLFAREWISLLEDVCGIDENRFVWINKTEKKTTIHIDELYCLDNIIDSGKAISNIMLDFSKSFIKRFNAVNHNCLVDAERIFLKRKGKRCSLNCEGILKEYGFITIVPEEHSLVEQIMIIRNAKVVVAEHGASLSNCMFMKDGSIVVELFGPGFVDLFFVEIFNLKKIKYRMLVGQKEYAEYRVDEDYVIHPTLLRMTLDEITNVKLGD